jgi:hypothetical protein
MQEEVCVYANFEESNRHTEQANAWLAKFEPLIEAPTGVQTNSESQQRLSLVTELRDEYLKLQFVSSSIEPNVLATLQQAYSQLDSIEAENQPTPTVKPVDIESLQAKLARREASQELGLPLHELRSDVLEIVTQRSNWGAAVATGIFGIGWTSFTLIHSILFIGGFKQAIGWLALGFLCFYGIFYFAGFAMLASAFQSASTQSIHLQGRRLRVRRELGFIKLEKFFTIEKGTNALIGKPRTMMTSGNKQGAQQACVLLVDEKGKEIQLCQGESEPTMRKVVQQINSLLEGA